MPQIDNRCVCAFYVIRNLAWSYVEEIAHCTLPIRLQLTMD
jgi:hypothetical protein